MNEANFVKRMNWIVTGDSFLKERPLESDAFKVTATGAGITAASAPTSVVNGASYNDADTSLLTFMVPMDYDEDGDRMLLKLVVIPGTSTSGHTSDIGITSAQSIWRAGAVVDATAATAEAESATDHVTGFTREVYLSLSSGAGSYQAGDMLRRTIDANNSSTSELTMIGASIIYGSCFAAYNTDDRHRDVAFTTGD